MKNPSHQARFAILCAQTWAGPKCSKKPDSGLRFIKRTLNGIDGNVQNKKLKFRYSLHSGQIHPVENLFDLFSFSVQTNVALLQKYSKSISFPEIPNIIFSLVYLSG